MDELNIQVIEAAEKAGVKPEDFATMSDEDILAVRGIGKGSLKTIRESFPYVEQEGPEAPEPEETGSKPNTSLNDAQGAPHAGEGEETVTYKRGIWKNRPVWRSKLDNFETFEGSKVIRNHIRRINRVDPDTGEALVRLKE